MRGIAREWTEKERELAEKVVRVLAEYGEVQGCARMARMVGLPTRVGKILEGSKRKLQVVMPLATQMMTIMHPGATIMVDDFAGHYAMAKETTDRMVKVNRRRLRRHHTGLTRDLHATLRDTPAGNFQAGVIGAALAVLESPAMAEALGEMPAEDPTSAA